MRVDGKGAVIALYSQRPVQQGIDGEGVLLPRLIGHLGCGMIDIDESAIEVRESHGHP